MNLPSDTTNRIFREETQPSMHRRCHDHDYRSISYYMITLSKNPAFKPAFCRIFDVSFEAPDFDAAKARSNALTPGIKRILLSDKAGTAGSSVPGSSSRDARTTCGSLSRDARAASGSSSRDNRAACGSSSGVIPAIELTDTGALIRLAFRDFFKIHPMLLLKKIVVMPDHIHFIIHVREYLPDHLGHYIGLLKHTCSRYVCNPLNANITKSSESDKDIFPVFEDNYHDRIIRNQNMLETERRYLDDNPRRYLFRKMHPEFFSSPVILTIGEEQYAAFGNILLLRKLHPIPVIISSKYTEHQLKEFETGWREATREHKALASPFISKAEKSIREEILINGGTIVEILDNGFPEKYKPWGRNFDLCMEGRLLQIAPIAYNTSKTPLSRAKALELNSLARRLCQHSASATVLRVRSR